MQLYRIKLKPLSPWRTPWQADTLAGLLCRACARIRGGNFLHEHILQPALNDNPSFLVSDAFPGDLLPVPDLVRLWKWPNDQFKAVRQARWVRLDSFKNIQAGHSIAFEDLLVDESFQQEAHVHNTLDRLTDTTQGDSLSIFTLQEHWINGVEYLSVYVRVVEEFKADLLALFEEVSQTGFGADVSIGKGQFELASGFESFEQLDDLDLANGVISLSTFQPNKNDPTDGGWQAFTKFGKLAEDFGIDNIFKRPLVMLRPGAFFHSSHSRWKLGRAIPMDQILSQEACQALRSNGVEIAHLAFGLAVPVRI